MKLLKPLLLIFLCFLSAHSFAESYANKQVGYVRSPDHRPCVLFQLKNVSEAGSTNSPWFALPFSHHAYKDTLAMLLAAKMAEKPITVTIFPRKACGHAEFSVIGLP